MGSLNKFTEERIIAEISQKFPNTRNPSHCAYSVFPSQIGVVLRYAICTWLLGR